MQVDQYARVLNSPLEDAERLFYEQRIMFDNPLFLYCALNVVVKMDFQGRKVPSKTSQRERLMDLLLSFVRIRKQWIK